MYSPNNDCVYSKAFTGCLAGLGGGGRYLDANAGDESAYAQMAAAYAQELDTVWGASAPTSIEEDAIASISFAVWRTRSPLESSIAFLPGAYNGIVRGVIALAQEGNAQVVSQGIDPNGCGGGGGAGLGSNFVYQPGGTAGGNVFTSWPLLIAAVNKVHGMRTILVDGTFASPTVPAGTWAVDNVLFYGETPGGAEPTLTFADGAHLTANTLYVEYVVFSSVSTSPVMTFAGGAGAIITFIGSGAFTSGTPFFSVAADAGNLSIQMTASSLGDGVNPALEVDGAAIAFLQLLSQSTLFSNATTGTGTLEISFDPEAPVVPSNPFPLNSDTNLQFPQLAGLIPANVAPTTPFTPAQQWLANMFGPVVVSGLDAVQTANNNSGDLANVALGNAATPLPNNLSGHAELAVVARIPSTGQTVMWHAECAFKKTGGVISVGTLLNVGGAALSLFGATAGDAAAFAGTTIALAITANGVVPRVTGVAPLVIDWSVKATYIYTHA